MTAALGIAAAVCLTLGIYIASLRIAKAFPSPFTRPVLVASVALIATLAAARIPLAVYAPGQHFITMWIGPACAALGVTTYENFGVLRRQAVAVIVSLTAGFAATAGCAIGLAHAFGLSPNLLGVLAMKSTTLAVGIQIVPYVHVSPALVALIVIGTGICGATIGPPLLSALKIEKPVARGLALGGISHGIGTSQAAAEGATSGAAASFAMCLVAIAMSTIVVPMIEAAASPVK